MTFDDNGVVAPSPPDGDEHAQELPMSTTDDERKDVKKRDDKRKKPDLNEIAKRIVDKATDSESKPERNRQGTD